MTVCITSQSFQEKFSSLLDEQTKLLAQKEKEQLLLPLLNYLHQSHQIHCKAYGNIMQGDSRFHDFKSLQNLPYLAVRLFKHLDLKSIADSEIFKVLQSSGTTSQTPARIYLDKETSSRQSKTLVKILQQSIGKQRLPMLIIDSPNIVKNPKFSARAAGIQGLTFFGRDHTYALDENMQPNWPVLQNFAEKYADKPVLMFGFTFMVWQSFVQSLRQLNKTLNFAQGILIHSGGWKKLEAEKVDNQTFKRVIKQQLGVGKVHNFYGMAEQVGSIFVECSEGHLHAPVMADVIVRDPQTLEVAKSGQSGLIQVLSVLPTSYPGHSLLTEDMGRILGIDDCPCGQKGKYFVIEGRLPKTEVRGCSDTQMGDVHV